MDRVRYEALAAERGWSPRTPVTRDETLNEWGSRYLAGSALVVLTGADQTLRRGRTTYPAFRSCNVVVVQPSEDWRVDMDALASELGFNLREPNPRAPYQRFPVGEGQEWTRRDAFITWSHKPAEDILRLELYRSLDSSFKFPRR